MAVTCSSIIRKDLVDSVVSSQEHLKLVPMTKIPDEQEQLHPNLLKNPYHVPFTYTSSSNSIPADHLHHGISIRIMSLSFATTQKLTVRPHSLP